MSAAAAPVAAPPRNDLLGWITSTDHKRIGILYLTTSLGYFAIAGRPCGGDPHAARAPQRHGRVRAHVRAAVHAARHGDDLPVRRAVRAGAGELFASRCRSARPDMAFPRLNALSYWMFLFGGLVIFAGAATNEGAAAAGWTSYAPLADDQGQHRPGSGSVDHRRVLGVGGDDPDVDQLHHDGVHLPRARDDDVAHPDLHVGDGRDVAARVHGVPGAGGRPAAAVRRPAPGRARVRPRARRQRDPVAAPVLVLRPPRSVRDDLAVLRRDQRDRPGVLAQADLRLHRARDRGVRHRRACRWACGRTTCSPPAP